MGQIMKYYQYPSHGTGSYSYTHPKYGNISVNFGSATYNWGNMPDAASETDHAETAKLLYHCGVAAETYYGPATSASRKVPVMNALVSYFGYSPNAELIFKNNYTDDRWKKLIRAELDNHRPVYYDGSPCETCDGHSFVCDGYQTDDFFHFNWGWSGNYNGYFYISDLTPGTHDFTPFQSAIIGIVPDTQKCTPPLHLKTEVNSNDVIMNWSAPAPKPVTDWIHYDNEYGGSTEFALGSTFKVAMRFDTAQLAAYHGMKLTKIRIMVGRQSADYRLNVWKGENAASTLLDEAIPDEILLDWINIYGKHTNLWNSFILDQPILIDSKEELWIGYTCINTAGGKGSAGHDKGPAVTGYGEMILLENSYWRSMHLGFPTWNYNWSIQAFVTDVYGNTIPLELKASGLTIENGPGGVAGNGTSTKSAGSDLSLLGYTIFRDGTQLNTQPLNQLTFTDYDLAPGIYRYTVKAVYNSGTSVESGPAEATVKELILNPPQQLQAHTSGRDVQLSWDKPYPPESEEWIRYDDGYNLSSIGLSSGGSFNVAMRFAPDQLAGYAGMYICKVRLYVCAHNTTYQLFVAKGANASTPVINLPLQDIEIDQWDTVDIKPPVPIDITQELWIGYKIFNHPSNDSPAGTDNGPAKAGYGDMISTSGNAYVSVYSVNPAINFNWNIEALITNRAGTKSSLADEGPSGPRFRGDDRKGLQLLGYNLYRNDDRVNTGLFVNTDWLDKGLPAGSFNYYVKAQYDQGESLASNTVNVSFPVSIDDIIENQKVKLYPNPATSFIMLEMQEIFNRVELYDMIGNEVYRNNDAGSKLKIVTQGLKPGMYIIQVTTGSSIVRKKISIK